LSSYSAQNDLTNRHDYGESFLLKDYLLTGQVVCSRLLTQVVGFDDRVAYVGSVTEEMVRRHDYPLVRLLFHNSYRSAMS